MTKQEAEEWLPYVRWLNGNSTAVVDHLPECDDPDDYAVHNPNVSASSDENYWVGAMGGLYYKTKCLDTTRTQLKALYFLATGNNERKTT